MIKCMMLQNYAWVKNPFKVKDRSIHSNLTEYEHSLIPFKFHIAINLKETTICWILVSKKNIQNCLKRLLNTAPPQILFPFPITHWYEARFSSCMRIKTTDYSRLNAEMYEHLLSQTLNIFAKQCFVTNQMNFPEGRQKYSSICNGSFFKKFLGDLLLPYNIWIIMTTRMERLGDKRIVLWIINFLQIMCTIVGKEQFFKRGKGC